MEIVNNINQQKIDHPWKNKNRLIILYDLFSANIIPCLSVYRNNGLCCGDDCPFAHIHDSYQKSIDYANNYYHLIEPARQHFKNWNHYQYLQYKENK